MYILWWDKSGIAFDCCNLDWFWESNLNHLLLRWIWNIDAIDGRNVEHQLLEFWNMTIYFFGEGWNTIDGIKLYKFSRDPVLEQVNVNLVYRMLINLWFIILKHSSFGKKKNKRSVKIIINRPQTVARIPGP